MPFHRNVGSLITLKNNGCTATRRNPHQDFNNAIVFSSDPLTDDALFEIKIDKRIEIWSGSVDIGVTACDPASIDLPSCASCLLTDTWIMSGATILHNGRPILNGYGHEQHPLHEGDTLGVMRNRSGQLHIYVNDTDLGVAASGIPATVWAVVDLYGKCTEVSLVNPASRPSASGRSETGDAVSMSVSTVLHTADSIFRDLAHRMRRQSSAEHALLAAALEAVSSSSTHAGQGVAPLPEMPAEEAEAEETRPAGAQTPLQFHEKSGKMVRLSVDRRTAERRRPSDEFNNAVVMTNRPLQPGEFFELRIDNIIQKWTGSIEMGVTTHNPDHIDLPATMSNLRSGTIIMSGCGILTNGRGTRREYGEFHLDVLKVGDRVGMMLKSTNHLHFYINGRDQGMAAVCQHGPYWGVVDLYGMTVKVTLLHPEPAPPAPAISPSLSYRQLEGVTRGALAAAAAAVNAAGRVVRRESGLSEDEDNYEETEKLVFHHRTGDSVHLDNSNRTAYRNNPEEDFNEGVVITNRPLRPGEIFTVQLERTVSKWAGTLELGVTTANPAELRFPTTMTNLTSSDTFMMTSNGVMHNGVTVLDHYGPPSKKKGRRSGEEGADHRFVLESSLEEEEGATAAGDDDEPDRLQVWDLVGVQRRPDGELHFFVNGVDLGCAAHSVPPVVYGVVDLYGRAAQVSILSPAAAAAALDAHQARLPPPLAFHHSHGRNACVAADGCTAFRPHAQSEFNDAMMVSTRPLLDDELFEVRVERMVDRWSGSLEAGVTLIPPERLRFPSTMTDLEHETWVLSGNSVMRDGKTIQSAYTFDLDRLTLGSRVGLLRRSDGTLHFFLDGKDMGAACRDVPESVYALIDLYGQCAQVSLTGRTGTLVPCGATVIPEEDPASQAPAVIMSTSMETTERPETTQPASSMTASNTAAHEAAGTPTAPAETRDTSASPGEGLDVALERFLRFMSVPSGQSVDTNMSDLTNRSRAANVCKFNLCHGAAIRLDDSRSAATRKRSVGKPCLGALAFSADPIRPDDLFLLEVGCTEPRPDLPCGDVGGLLGVGLVDWVVDREAVAPDALPPFASLLEKPHWLLTGGHVVGPGRTGKANYAPRLELASAEPVVVGVHYSAEATLSFFLDGMWLGVAAENVPKNCFLVVDLGGAMNSVKFTGVRHLPMRRAALQSGVPARVDDIGELLKSEALPGQNAVTLSGVAEEEETAEEVAGGETETAAQSVPDSDRDGGTAEPQEERDDGLSHDEDLEADEMPLPAFWRGAAPPFLFGPNIRLHGHAHKITRCQGFRHGLVVGRTPLAKLQLFQVRVNRVEERGPSGEWQGSLSLGFIASRVPPDELFPSDRPMPDSASNLLAGRPALSNPENICSLSYCQVTGSSVVVDRIPYRSLHCDLSRLLPGQWAGLLLDSEGTVRLSVNGDDLGPLLASDCVNTSLPLYPFVDVYGRCKEVTLATLPSVALSLSRDRIAEKAGTELNLDAGEKHRPSPTTPASSSAAETGGHPTSGDHPALCHHRRLSELACRLLFLPESAFRGEARCFCSACCPPSPELDLNHDLPKDPDTLPPGWERLGLQRGGPGSLGRAHQLAYMPRVSGLQLRLLLHSGDPTRIAWEEEKDAGSWGGFLCGGGVADGGERERECGRAVRMLPDVGKACALQDGRGFEFVHNKRTYVAHFVVEVRVRPGSYTVAAQATTGSAALPVWATKEMGAVLPTGLLVKVVSV